MEDDVLSELRARVQALEDRAAIEDIINRYGQGVRTGDHLLTASCFADDAVIDHGHGQPVQGIENIRRYFGGSTDNKARSTVLNFDRRFGSTPVMTNIEMKIDGDTAHCESMCLAIHVGSRADQTSVMVRGTRNIDELVRTPEGWRIRHRVHPAVWKFEVPGESLMEGH